MGNRNVNDDIPLWRNRDFTRLFWAHAISLLGGSVSAVALGLLAHELVEAQVSQVVGIALAIRIAVVVLLSPFAGTVADRLGGKTTMILADLVRAAVVVGFFFTTSVWQIYLLAFLLNTASALFTPVYKAAIPNLVPQEQYPRAVSFGSVAYDFANIAGPALAALLIAWIGFRGNFLINALTFLVSAALIFPVRLPHHRIAPTAKPRRWHGMKALLTRRELLRALFLSVQISIVSGFVLVATVDYVMNHLALPDSFYGLAMAAYGIGSVAGALAYGGTSRAGLRRWIIILAPWAMALGLVTAALSHGFAALLVAWLLAGAGQAALGVRGNQLLAAHSIPEERGHIYAAHFSLSHVGWGVTYPLAGWMTTAFGFNRAALAFSLLLALALVAYAVAFLARRSDAPGPAA